MPKELTEENIEEVRKYNNDANILDLRELFRDYDGDEQKVFEFLESYI